MPGEGGDILLNKLLKFSRDVHPTAESKYLV